MAGWEMGDGRRWRGLRMLEDESDCAWGGNLFGGLVILTRKPKRKREEY